MTSRAPRVPLFWLVFPPLLVVGLLIPATNIYSDVVRTRANACLVRAASEEPEFDPDAFLANQPQPELDGRRICGLDKDGNVSVFWSRLPPSAGGEGEESLALSLLFPLPACILGLARLFRRRLATGWSRLALSAWATWSLWRLYGVMYADGDSEFRFGFTLLGSFLLQAIILPAVLLTVGLWVRRGFRPPSPR